MAIGWPELLGAITVVSFIVGIATAYLRLFVKSETMALRETMRQEIDRRYIPGDVIKEQLSGIDRRLEAIEKKITLSS